MNDIVAFIEKVGFPVFIALFLLVRFDRRLLEIENILKDLVREIKKSNGGA